MTASIHGTNKDRINILRAALYDSEPTQLLRQLNEAFAVYCVTRLASPFEDLDRPAELLERAYLPPIQAVPDLERRDVFVMAGHSPGQWSGAWVGGGGCYMGVFERAWRPGAQAGHAAVHLALDAISLGCGLLHKVDFSHGCCQVGRGRDPVHAGKHIVFITAMDSFL